MVPGQTETERRLTKLGPSRDLRPHIYLRFEGAGRVNADIYYKTIEEVDHMMAAILTYMYQTHGDVFTKGLLNWARKHTHDHKEIQELLKNLQKPGP